MVTKEDCERQGKIFVASHRMKDGTLIHPYCREEGISTRRDKNGITRIAWKRYIDNNSNEIKYVINNGKGREGIVIKPRDGYPVWEVDDKDYVSGLGGRTRTVSEAKFEAAKRVMYRREKWE